MKKLLILLCSFLCLPCAAAQNVLVLFDNSADNYYGFPEVSQIIASDVVGYFNESGKIRAARVVDVNKKISKNETLKNLTRGALGQYKNTKTIDYAAYRTIARDFGADYVLLILSDVDKRSLWEVLHIASAFGTGQIVTLQTQAVLVDTRSDLVMWSRTYNKKVKHNGGDVTAHLENIRMYSADILARDVSQNIVLRFYPKSVRSIARDVRANNGEVLRYDRTNPKPKSNIDAGNYGETLFSL